MLNDSLGPYRPLSVLTQLKTSPGQHPPSPLPYETLVCNGGFEDQSLDEGEATPGRRRPERPPSSWFSLATRAERVHTSTAGREPGARAVCARAVRDAGPQGHVPAATPVRCQKRRCHGSTTQALLSPNPGCPRETALNASRTPWRPAFRRRKGSAPLWGKLCRKNNWPEVEMFKCSEHQLLWSTRSGRAIFVGTQ